MSPSSFWFSKVEACYWILAEDLALCTSCRRASLINFHYWTEMKKKTRIFSFFFQYSPSILLGISPVEAVDPPTPSFLFPPALEEKCFELCRQCSFTNKTSTDRKCVICFRLGSSTLTAGISNNRSKPNFIFEHSWKTISLHRKVLKWKISIMTIFSSWAFFQDLF